MSVDVQFEIAGSCVELVVGLHARSMHSHGSLKCRILEAAGTWVRGVDRCSEFACQSYQKLPFPALLANCANWRINNLRGIRGSRTNESLFLRHAPSACHAVFGASTCKTRPRAVPSSGD